LRGRSINNAGVASFGNPLTKNFDEISTEMEVNYFGTLRVSRVVASTIDTHVPGADVPKMTTAYVPAKSLPRLGMSNMIHPSAMKREVFWDGSVTIVAGLRSF